MEDFFDKEDLIVSGFHSFVKNSLIGLELMYRKEVVPQHPDKGVEPLKGAYRSAELDVV